MAAQTETGRGRLVAALAASVGVAFVAYAAFLFVAAPGRTDFFVFYWVAAVPVLAYGACLLAAAWYGRHGDATRALLAAVAVGVVWAAGGPLTGYPIGLLLWSALCLVVVGVVGIPVVVTVRRAARASHVAEVA